MLDLFLKDNSVVREPKIIYSQFDFIRRNYLASLETVLEYYYYKNRAVNNSHIFSRLIKMCIPSLNLDIIDYFKYVDSSARYVAKQFGITSNLSDGYLHENVLYASNSLEGFLLTENDVDLFDTEHGYLNNDMVRCIHTEETDLDMYVFFGRKELTSESISVYELDLISMCMQYRHWAIGRLNTESSTDVNVFVACVVLPRIATSMIDLTLYNRFVTIAKGEYLKPFRIRHPFPITDYSDKIDNVLVTAISNTVNNRISIRKFLNNVPAIHNEQMFDAFVINNIYYNKQSSWLLWLARLKTITDILLLLGPRGIAYNRSIINELPALVKALAQRSTNIDNKLNSYQYERFIGYLEIIKNKIGIR